ncbi:MAG: DUF4232 domain-containing protein [Acidobacteriota bacterium]|nr:DUF4232 domain-containing protein [Acidobacteriota bacterium]
MRRNQVKYGATILVGVLSLTTLLLPWIGGPAAASQRRTIPAGTLLTNTSLNGFTQIDQIDMLSPRLGYALATGSLGRGHYAYYLVRTTNLGKTWTVRSEIAANLQRYPVFADYNGANTTNSLDFVNARVGYVNGAGGSLDVTNDGGLTWNQITPANSFSSYAITGATTSVTVTMCPPVGQTATSICKSAFELYRTGSTKPVFSTSIQVPDTHYEPTVELLGAAPHGIDVVNVSVGNVTSATSLRITHNNGRTWRTLANPCATLPIEQLLIASNNTWMLSCFLDEGMSQGPGRLLRSTNEGRTWTTEFNDPLPTSNGPFRSDTPMYLFFSGNNRLLYAVIMNPAGGVSVSANYGRTFTNEHYFANTGGAPGSITSFGPTSMIYQVLGGPAFVTRDSRTWKLMPQLVAGRYRQSSICTKRNTRVSWRSIVVAGLRYVYLDFTNHGANTCYLNGVPTMQPLSSRGNNVGPPLTGENFSAGGDFVLLHAHGGVANVALSVNPVSGYHPASSCALAKVKVLRIDFAPPSRFTYQLNTHAMSVCTTQPSVYMNQVRGGLGRP